MDEEITSSWIAILKKAHTMTHMWAFFYRVLSNRMSTLLI